MIMIVKLCCSYYDEKEKDKGVLMIHTLFIIVFLTSTGFLLAFIKRPGTSSGCTCYVISEALLLFCMKLGEFIEIGWRYVDCLQYLAVLINAFAALQAFVRYGRKPGNELHRLLAWALFTTAAADFFLSMIGTEGAFVPGVLLFCIVQLLYAFWLDCGYRSFLLRGILFLAAAAAAFCTGMLTLPAALGLLDLSLLLVNVLTAWRLPGERVPALFRAGMTLFLCCDVTIAVKMISSGTLYDAAAFMVWVFYVPSQVCITVTCVRSLQAGVGPNADGTI